MQVFTISVGNHTTVAQVRAASACAVWGNKVGDFQQEESEGAYSIDWGPQQDYGTRSYFSAPGFSDILIFTEE